MKKWLLAMALLSGSVLLHPQQVTAQQDQTDSDPPTTAPDSATALPVPEQQPAAAGNDAEPSLQEPSLDSTDPSADDAQESQGRFIPTEQISQDLGVSFPVDI